MLYDFFGDKAKAEKYLKLAIDKSPNEISSYTNLLNFYIQNKDKEKAKILRDKIELIFKESSSY